MSAVKWSQLFKSYNSSWKWSRETLKATRTNWLQPGADENCQNTKSSYGFSIFFRRTVLKNKYKQWYVSVIYFLSGTRSLRWAVVIKRLENNNVASPRLSALSCSAAARCNLVSARGLHMILTPRSARLVPRELTRARARHPRRALRKLSRAWESVAVCQFRPTVWTVVGTV